MLAAGKGFHKTEFYSVFPPADNPDIFTETNEHAHAVKKRYASNAYSMAAMQGLSGYIEDTQKLLVSKLDQKCKSSEQTCDLGDWLVSAYNRIDCLTCQALSVDSSSIALLRVRRTWRDCLLKKVRLSGEWQRSRRRDQDHRRSPMV